MAQCPPKYAPACHRSYKLAENGGAKQKSGGPWPLLAPP